MALRADAVECNAQVRAHWGIENGWRSVFDVTFNEDDCLIRRGGGAHDFALLRRIALNLAKQEKADKSSLPLKRLRAGWSTDYLRKLLGLHPR